MASEAAIEAAARQYWDEGEAAMVRFGVRYLPMPWNEGDIEARAAIIRIARQIITAFEQTDEQKRLLEYVARIAYAKGAKGIVNLNSEQHDIGSTIRGAYKWMAEDVAVTNDTTLADPT